MRVNRVQERSSGDAVSAASFVAGRIRWSGIATDDVIAGATGIIRVINPELGIVKDIEGFSSKFELAGFGNLEVLGEGYIKADATGIVQGVAAGIAESKPAGGDEL